MYERMPRICLSLLSVAWIGLAASPADARFLPGVSTPTLDLVDIVVRKREVLAVEPSARGIIQRTPLMVGEDVLWAGARGRVGIVVTDKRLLGITTNSGGWREIRFKIHESEPISILLGDRVAVVLTDMRALGMSTAGSQFHQEYIGTNETPLDAMVGDNVAAIVTDRRVIGLSGFLPGFAQELVGVHEDLEYASTLPNFVTIGTDDRILIFRAPTGAWEAQRVSLY